MPLKEVMTDDWSDYDDKKKSKQDAMFFSFEQRWERDYLKDKILRLHPNLKDTAVIDAMQACYKVLEPPHPRANFVECVMIRLGYF